MKHHEEREFEAWVLLISMFIAMLIVLFSHCTNVAHAQSRGYIDNLCFSNCVSSGQGGWDYCRQLCEVKPKPVNPRDWDCQIRCQTEGGTYQDCRQYCN